MVQKITCKNTSTLDFYLIMSRDIFPAIISKGVLGSKMKQEMKNILPTRSESISF